MKSGLVSDVERMFKEQSVTWPLLACGHRGLREGQSRWVRIGWHEVLVRHIPHRITSTTAMVDPKSIRERPCFICRANLFPEQLGVVLDSEFAAYCNPFPILDRHLTIIHNDHRPQAIAGQVGAMLRLAEMLPGFFLVYNGPECGASAPDHLHFQACSRNIFPIEKDAQHVEGLFIPDYSRRVFVLRDGDALRLAARIEHLISLLADVTDKAPEPLVNITAFYETDRWTAFVFPRGKHRPRVYQTGEMMVSPATIDLSGVFVVPRQEDFERIGGADIQAIFQDVTLGEDAFNRVLMRMGESH